MNQKNLITIIFVIIAGGIIAWLLIGNQKPTSDTTDRLTVGATIFPLYDIAREIAGDQADVLQILPSGASPHTYELTPADIKRLEKAQIIFKIGEGLDDWINNISDSLGGVQFVEADEGITLRTTADEHDDADAVAEDHEEGADEGEHTHDGNDPHYWLSVVNAQIIAATIADELSRLDPDRADQYATNLTNYTAALTTLKADVQSSLASLDDPALITFHDSYRYFAAEFGLDIVGVFELTPGAEPTPQQLTELHALVDEHNITALFSEPQLSDAVIRPFANDTELPVYELDPLGGVNGRQSYIELIQYNADTIVNAYQQ